MRSTTERPGSEAGRSAMACSSKWLVALLCSGSSNVPPVVTFTEVLRAAMLILTAYAVGKAERISMMALNGENPSLSTRSWYGPKGRLRAVSKPASSVLRMRWSCDASLERVMEAFTPRPRGSATLRRSSPALLCAMSGRATRTNPRWSSQRTVLGRGNSHHTSGDLNSFITNGIEEKRSPLCGFTKCRQFRDKTGPELEHFLSRFYAWAGFRTARPSGSQASRPPSPGRHGEKLALVPQGVRAPVYF